MIHERNEEKLRIMRAVQELFDPHTPYGDKRYLCILIRYDVPRYLVGIGFDDNAEARRELEAEVVMWFKPEYPGAPLEAVLDPERELCRHQVEDVADELRRQMIDALIAKYSGLEYEFPDVSSRCVS